MAEPLSSRHVRGRGGGAGAGSGRGVECGEEMGIGRGIQKEGGD